MYLKELSLQGFKTFATKTTIQFLPPQSGAHSITAVVGPNGSGKSNVADAIRWVLGEQSMRALRGKAASDVIFSGSDGKTRAGFAEVELTFADADTIEGIDVSELTLTRRLYRDGESVYSMNGQQARLSDIHMFLAQANVGQRSYAIVSQGHIDHVLAASPEERKGFFDDATGVKPLQLKRHQAVLKLNRTQENLSQAELLLEELAPRLRTLERLVKRLNEREEVEQALRSKQEHYYGSQWRTLQTEQAREQAQFDAISKDVEATQRTLNQERTVFAEMEAAAKSAQQQADQAISSQLSDVQAHYERLQERRTQLREEQFECEKRMERERAARSAQWTPLPLHNIIEELEQLQTQAKDAHAQHRAGTLTLEVLADLEARSSTLVQRLKKPAPEAYQPSKEDTQALEQLRKEDAKLVAELTTLKQRMTDLAQSSTSEKQELFALQRRMLAAQETLHTLETKRNNHRVALARLETRAEDVEREIKEAFGSLPEAITSYQGPEGDDALYSTILTLRHKLELIGGIDEETVAEFTDAKERHTFLESQTQDLASALRDTQTLVEELDEQIAQTSTKTFRQIRERFQHYFKILFRGGTCDLKEVRVKDLEQPQQLRLDGEEESQPTLRSKKELERVVGIEIFATPPGKKLKSINLLSGGERAMTSIALISAIMDTNPSPFVVLDEVDAALDEANTQRFADIVKELSPQTQFILITHNRATMHIADALYGVTMKQDGVSQLLSVKFEDVTQAGTARR